VRRKLPSPILRSELRKDIQAALQAAASAIDLDHAGFRGRVREILTARLLRPILPPGIDIGTGKITDSEGNLSAETDLVIFSRGTLPPLIYEHTTGIFPVEACVYSIEVKSVLTASELQDSLEKIRRLKTLRYLYSFYPLNFVAPIGPPSSIVIPALFAFNSDLNLDGTSEIDRYRKYDASANTAPLLPIICIPGRGYWYFGATESGPRWLYHPPTSDYDEIIDFIAGIANTIPTEIWKKGQPYYGNYIMMPDRKGVTC
jgi:hypothetical protein